MDNAFLTLHRYYYFWLVLLFFKFAVCPAGFRGLNCSSKCNAPKYGLGCVEQCECDPCHHIYGCNLTITELGKYSNNVLKVVKIVAIFITFIQTIRMSCLKFFSYALFGDSYGNENVIQNIHYSHMLLCINIMLPKKNPLPSLRAIRKVQYFFYIYKFLIRSKCKLLNCC